MKSDLLVATAETTPLTRDASSSSSPEKSRDTQEGSRSIRVRNMVLLGTAILAVVGVMWITRHPGSVFWEQDALEGPDNFPVRNSADGDDDWIPNVLGTTNYSLPITIAVPPGNPSDIVDRVQHLVDVGLMDCYGFAFGEAQRTAARALSALEHTHPNNVGGNDASLLCPMCYWLLAMSHSPFINHPHLSPQDYQAASRAAATAVQTMKILPKGEGVTLKERGLMLALQQRYPSGPEHDSTPHHRAYAKALEDLHRTLPDDQDIMAFLADAIMVSHCDGTGYHFYQSDDLTPQPGIARATHLLETCLGLPAITTSTTHPTADNDSFHPLCEHLYIHITEPSKAPQRANRTADQLSTLVARSQAQHLQHMPSHTYLRVGRYHDAITANLRAHKSDEAYLGHHHVPYGPAHDTAFLVHAAQLSGEQAVAYRYADQLQLHYRTFPDQPDYPGPSMGWHIWSTVRLRFGDFDAVLQFQQDELPRDDWIYGQILGHFTRGVATLMASATRSKAGDTTTTFTTTPTRPQISSSTMNKSDPSRPSQEAIEDASRQLRELQSLLPVVEKSLKDVASVANLSLAASIAFWNETNSDQSLEFIHIARIQQESWVYTEPPAWFISIAQCEATLLQITGRVKDAVTLLEQDLESIRENRFALYGLEQAMMASPNDFDESTISSVRRRYRRAIMWADDTKQSPLVCPLFGEVQLYYRSYNSNSHCDPGRDYRIYNTTRRSTVASVRVLYRGYVRHLT